MEPSLGSLGSNGTEEPAPRRRKKDEREVLDFTKPVEVVFCAFEKPFFNSMNSTVMYKQHFAAGESNTEGLVRRMLLHPNGTVEMLLESQLTGKFSVAILRDVKTCVPLYGKYRSVLEPEPKDKQEA